MWKAFTSNKNQDGGGGSANSTPNGSSRHSSRQCYGGGGGEASSDSTQYSGKSGRSGLRTPSEDSFGTSSHTQNSKNSAMFSSLSSNLMRSQHHRDPMVIYEVMEVLGKGSMGSVSRVRKRDEAVGGSARSHFVQKHFTPRGKNELHSCWLGCWHHMMISSLCPATPFSHRTDGFEPVGSGNKNKDSGNSKFSASSQSSFYNSTPPPSSRPPSSRLHSRSNSPPDINVRTCVGGPIIEGKEHDLESAFHCNDDQCQHHHHIPSHLENIKKTPITSNITTTSSNITTPSSSLRRTAKTRGFRRQPSSMISYSRHGDGKTKRNAYYALKSIHLSRCSSPEFRQELKNEVEILKTLDHPNIVRAIETFDYKHRLFIVLELCNGGDLYTREPYDEADAKQICKSLFSAVAYLHSKDIIHRDLKFENVMFVNEKSDQVKLIDFGLSQKFASSHEHLHDQVGTVYTMAPELLAGDYHNKADVWSLGVISFMLLSSSMPFFGKTRVRVIKKILKGKYQFSSRRWTNVSADAMRFVADCLTMKPEERPSAEEALHLPWLCDKKPVLSASSSGIGSNGEVAPELDQLDQVQACMQAFAHYGQLKKLALMVVAYKSTSDEIGFLRHMFEKYDVQEHGEISLQDFKEALSAYYDYSDEELENMFHGIDVDGTGSIHYSEFLAATIEAHGFIDEERLAEAFDRIDVDDDGYITVGNLRDFLGDDVPAMHLEQIIDEADLQGTSNKRITYQEFIQLWNDEDDEILSQARSHVRSRHLTPQSSFISSISSYGSLSDMDEEFADENGLSGDEDVDRFAPERAASLAAATSLDLEALDRALANTQIAAEAAAAAAAKAVAAAAGPTKPQQEEESKPKSRQVSIANTDGAVAKPQRQHTTASSCFKQRKQMSVTKSMRRTLGRQLENGDDGDDHDDKVMEETADDGDKIVDSGRKSEDSHQLV